MTRVLSLLRGINVSGQKKIKMAELKSQYEKLGFTNVKSYIQSGNILFSPPKNSSKASLKKAIEETILQHYGFDVDVQIKTQDDWKAIVENCPFPITEETKTKLHLSFLSKAPSKNKIELLYEQVKVPEKLVIDKDIIYLYCPNGYGRSKLTNTVIESKLGVKATTRNWQTIEALQNLLKHPPT